MNQKRRVCLLCSFLSVAGLTASGQTAKHPTSRSVSTAKVDTEPAGAPTAKIIDYSDKDLILVKTKLRYTTLIVLPKNEQILDFTCGDKEFWVVNGNQNFAYIKPAKEGAQTNLNLVTASGNVYSFLLSEVSQDPKVEPDFKVFVELKDDAMLAASRSGPKFVPAAELEATRQQVAAAKDEARQVKQSEQNAIEKGIHQFVSNVRFAYSFEAGKKPFYVRAMYHDDRFTHIQARPEETPTLYEVKDGKPNLVNFEYRDGEYVVSKILDRGYLTIGKQKLGFKREE